VKWTPYRKTSSPSCISPTKTVATITSSTG
jgi:hypothetical protein